MPNDGPPVVELDEPVKAFYLRVMHALQAADAPFLVGGAYALRHYAAIERNTKDFDIFRSEEHTSELQSRP